MGAISFLDTILVPLSLFITIGYHFYLWHHLKHKPSRTTIGMNILKKRSWLRELNQVTCSSHEIRMLASWYLSQLERSLLEHAQGGKREERHVSCTKLKKCTNGNNTHGNNHNDHNFSIGSSNKQHLQREKPLY
ncbi:uncharacterized protein [Nicotiana tomentosiformis]|uniref:uncharacterized protein n=1 Tax=Nicotiana tomentosiformis TaxID=4098 RepID=UPI00388CCC02